MSVNRITCVYHANDPGHDRQDYETVCKCCPRGRSGHRIVVTENFIYSIGGYNPVLGNSLEPVGIRGFPLFKELWRFNLSTQEWQLMDDYFSVPPTIASHAVSRLGRWLFMFGGTSIPFGETPTNTVYRFNLSLGPHPLIRPPNFDSNDSNSEDDETAGNEIEAIHPSRSRWHVVPVEGEVPTERYGHSMTMHFPDVYIIGGTSGFIYNCDVYHLNLEHPTGRWTKLNFEGDHHQPNGRYRHETAYDGKKLYVFGGGTEVDACSLAVVHTFDIQKQCWKPVKSRSDPIYGFPKSRKCHSCSQLNLDVFLAGGIGQNSTTIYGDVWKFSLVSLTWTKLKASLPQPIYFHAADICQAKGLLYIFGGVMVHQVYAVRTQQLWSLRVGVSSLLELCWDVVCANLKNRCTKETLLDLELPSQLIERVP